jgi:hypothetical protein
MDKEGGRELDDLKEDYGGWPLRQRLELLAFDARLAGVPPALLEALWEANRPTKSRSMNLTHRGIIAGSRLRLRPGRAQRGEVTAQAPLT